MASSKPQIISNNQPHTVSLPTGSTVAARKAPRKPPPAPEVPEVAPPEARPLPAAPKPAARPAPKAAPKAEKRKAAAPLPPPPAPAVEQVGFGADIMQRLQGLRQRNDEVRAALDQLPVPTGAKR
ncbi:hypothetical protein ACT80S_12090 [Ramlibacter sp. MAHUQ-53]|uniref:hypothetical protein n=1 Tax=unclassified Ramlibacter TaxID=2617605 RepID=UPI003633B17B